MQVPWNRDYFRNGFGLVGVALMALSTACATTTSEASGQPGNAAAAQGASPSAAADEGEMVIVAGRIDPRDVRIIEGSTVRVFSVEAGGRLRAISIEGAPPTDELGRYQVAVRLNNEPRDLLIVARHPQLEGEGTVIVPSWSAVDQVIIAPPICLETGVESDIFLAAMKAGIWPEHLAANELRAMISDRLAAQLRTSPTYAKDVVVVAHAAVAAIGAWYHVLSRPSVGLDGTKIGAVFEALAWAQVALDAQLYAAHDETEKEEAEAMHDQAVRAAYAGVGIGPEHLAVAAQASADALRKYSGALGAPSQSMVMSEAEALRAKFVCNAVESLFVRAGAPDSETEAVKTAGARLEGKILSAPNATDDVDGFLQNAWSEYRKTVQGRLQSIAGKDSAREVI